MVKDILRQVLPPFIFVLVRNFVRRIAPVPPIYAGIYADPAELPVMKGNAFEHTNWISYVKQRALSRTNGVTQQDANEICLSLLASIGEIDRIEPYNVVDFGGGVGMYWPALKAQNKGRKRIRFTVVDSPVNCEIGQTLFGGDGVVFSSDLTALLADEAHIDLLNVSSTLQYCIEYRNIVALLCSSQAAFIVISRHPAPLNARAVVYTLQNVSTPKGTCGQIPVALISIGVLTQLMNEHGYVLLVAYSTGENPKKYWQNSKASIPNEFLEIVDHALVFQQATPSMKAGLSKSPQA